MTVFLEADKQVRMIDANCLSHQLGKWSEQRPNIAANFKKTVCCLRPQLGDHIRYGTLNIVTLK